MWTLQQSLIQIALVAVLKDEEVVPVFISRVNESADVLVVELFKNDYFSIELRFQLVKKILFETNIYHHKQTKKQ